MPGEPVGMPGLSVALPLANPSRFLPGAASGPPSACEVRADGWALQHDGLVHPSLDSLVGSA
jgi:hypothetical protein